MSRSSYTANPYFNDLPSPLPKDEQRDLARDYQDGDEEAGKKLIRTNLKYVVKLASDYNRSDVDYNDLVQAGNLGLQKALDKFDPSIGTPFTSYAYYWIRNDILNQIKMADTPMKISSNSGNHIYQNLRQTKKKLVEEDIKPTAENIAEELDEDPEEVRKIQSGLNVSSLNQEVKGMDDKTYQDQIEGDSSEESLEQEVLTGEIKGIMDEFREEYIDNDRDLYIWENRMVAINPDTLQEISDRWEVSQARIYQLEKRIKEDLRKWIKDNTDIY